ncbi:MAG: methionyl-tRNA formyltransferase [Bacilli bacterium]|nr:methionyl-tRNA formyltransferase [Bacilli bacterium]
MNKKDAKIIFMGTPEISSKVLEGLILDGYNIIAVIAQPDRPVGRKKILMPVPTKVVAEKYNIPVYQPVKIRKEYEFVNDLHPDLILTLAYGQIVPQGLLDIPTFGSINLHGSLLPKYRGAAPIQYALLNNDKVTGMTLMRMTKEMDAGEMYAKKEIEIDEEDNSTSLFIKMGDLALELAKESLPLFLEGKLEGIPQDESQVTFAPSIKPEEEKIDLNKTKEQIFGQIRALSETPGAYLYLNELKLKIYKAKIASDEILGETGTIVKADKGGLYLQTVNGIIALLDLQKEGKNRMDYKSFINGNQNLVGQLLK